jgi:molybdopterin synthase catalytic subunit
MFNLTRTPIEPDALQRKLAAADAGASVSFEGRVRRHNQGREVSSLEYEAFGELAEKEGTRIMDEAREKFAVISAACIHRVGHLQVGELAVWAAVTAEHRTEAFAACRYIIDEVKARVPIWKREHYGSGPTAWIAPAEGNRTGTSGPEENL